MSKALKLLGLLSLPVAVIVFAFAIFHGRTNKNGKNFFVREYDEQNIYS